MLSQPADVAGAANFDVSTTGTLVYVTGQGDAPTFNLVWVDRQGHEDVLSAEPRAYLYPRLSPDGTRVALDIRDANNDIWMWDLKGGTLTPVTVDPGLERFPMWMSNERLMFSSDRWDGRVRLHTSGDEVGKSQRLLDSATAEYRCPGRRDGRRIVIRRDRLGQGGEVSTTT